MKRYLVPILSLCFLGSSLSACLGHRAYVVKRSKVPQATIVVKERSLPKRVIRTERPDRPTGKFEWVKGHWAWSPDAGKYVWERGHWEQQRATHRWLPGHYEWKTRGRYKVKVWVKGHWEGSNAAPAPVQIVERTIPMAPPARLRKPHRPTGKYEWVSGHWAWSPDVGKYVWEKGHWERQRATHSWVPGHYEWKTRGRYKVKVWVKGQWEVSNAAPAPVQIVERTIPMAPPARLRKPRRPTGKYEWVSGHWAWSPDAGKYVWEKGHWERQRATHRWVPGHYEWKTRGRYKVKVRVKGHWEAAPKAAPARARVRQHNLPARPPRSATARPNPRRGKIWVKGHWKWNPRSDNYVWENGRYASKKRNMRWQRGHYVWEKRGNAKVKVWVSGRWARNSRGR